MKKSNHSNNLGFVRLVLALLVIVSHAPVMLDGNELREPLKRFLGSRPLGDLAVDAFFLLSGYLILQSFEQSSSKLSYLSKRVRRIYPGYLVCFAICTLIISPLTGLHFSTLNARDYFHIAMNAVALQGPPTAAFIGLPYETSNGSLWTISYEFRCYLVVLVLGSLGFYRNRSAFLAITILLVTATFFEITLKISGRAAFFIGDPPRQIRLLSALFCRRMLLPFQGPNCNVSHGSLPERSYTDHCHDMSKSRTSRICCLWRIFIILVWLVIPLTKIREDKFRERHFLRRLSLRMAHIGNADLFWSLSIADHPHGLFDRDRRTSRTT